MTDDLNKVDRLNIAAGVAPSLRNRRPGKVVKIVDKSGRVVREMSDAEFAAKVLERKGIEFDVGFENRVCAGSGLAPCQDRRIAPAGAFKPKVVLGRNGRPWRCRRCAALHRGLHMTDEERERKALILKSNRSRESIVRGLKKRQATMTDEQKAQRLDRWRQAVPLAKRQKNMRTASAAMTEEQKRARTGKLIEANKRRPAWKRSEISRKAQNSVSAFERSERVRKAWATRRAKAKK